MRKNEKNVDEKKKQKITLAAVRAIFCFFSLRVTEKK